MGQGVSLKEIVEKMNLKNLTPDVDLVEKYVQVPDINRPALQLSGYFDHFDSDRVQVIGYVEYTYLQTLEEAKKMKMYDELLSHKIPCLIFSRALEPDQELLEKATQADTPVLITQKSTSSFMAELIRWMNVKLAPCISIHGVLVDVYGVGVLIMGESGIGKSEAALELSRLFETKKSCRAAASAAQINAESSKKDGCGRRRCEEDVRPHPRGREWSRPKGGSH